MKTNKFKFGTKAENLVYFSSKLNDAQIPDFFYFTVDEWENNQDEIINKIANKFDIKIVVRSSTKNEDLDGSSNAGKYTSVLNINPQNNKQLFDGITTVIEDYKTDPKHTKEDQVIIQKQIGDVTISGVVFTSDQKDNAPYYIINFDDTGSTDSVTSGQVSKQIRVFKNYKDKIPSKEVERLLGAIKEIETYTNNAELDIEFAIDSQETVHIFQIRPLSISKSSNFSIEEYSKKLEQEKERLDDGEYLSNMAFWNPAEIVGTKPNFLDVSLYNYLVLEKNWNIGIAEIGYSRVDSPLYKNVLGRVYININKSFRALTPENLPVEIKTKLTKGYLSKLREYPELNDKIEFDIVHNCYTASTSKSVVNDDFINLSNEEREILIKSLEEITNHSLTNYKSIINVAVEECSKYIPSAEIRSKRHDSLEDGLKILEDCNNYQVHHFAKIARMAFIGRALLDSLKNEEIITKEEYSKIFSTVKTVATNISNGKDLSIEDLSNEYGHLRFGTYDITSLPYYKQHNLINDLLNASKNEPDTNVEVEQDTLSKIDKWLEGSPLNTNAETLIDFIAQTQVQREYIKFLFTKNLSAFLEILAEYGSDIGFSREELAYLDLEIINKSYRIAQSDVEKLWRDEISRRKTQKDFIDTFSLPDCIFDKNDLEYIESVVTRPNFITNNKVKGEIVELKANDLSNTDSLNGKIVATEKADPGYDFIFSKNIVGLITMYGGVASHMAIRCNEYGIPAVLGCGKVLYENLINAKTVEIDCKKETLRQQ